MMSRVLFYRLQQTLARCLLRLGIIAILLIPIQAGAETIIVLHPDIPAESLTQANIRAVFSLRKQRWENGEPVRLFVFPEDSQTHQAFCKEQLGIYSHLLRQTWDRRIFSGMAQTPYTVSSETEMRLRISQTPGAIGYLPAKTAHEGLQVLDFR